MTAACNFISSEEKMRELLDKNGKKKEKKKRGKLLITRLDKNMGEICALCRSVLLIEDTKKPHQVQLTKSMCFKRLLCC